MHGGHLAQIGLTVDKIECLVFGFGLYLDASMNTPNSRKGSRRNIGNIIVDCITDKGATCRHRGSGLLEITLSAQ